MRFVSMIGGMRSLVIGVRWLFSPAIKPFCDPGKIYRPDALYSGISHSIGNVTNLRHVILWISGLFGAIAAFLRN
ncbi:hypothetical protein QVE09_22985 [Paenibacillus sp. ClWae2A]|uniref:hypothetical protein n=1 Tax=Paenibacillus sp. ClWae2A TaxID=3057177 RepID=UPI0028F5597C|nr:hypothetical protein [Paenibacillus sp. ClWae2A]MDT9721774.1 hypothetical protein [Paenibacillus sp. ClWae2A]